MGLFDRIVIGRKARYERAMDGLTEALGAHEHDRAAELGREAVRVGEELFGPTDVRLSVPLYGLASALLSRGELDEAKRILLRALDGLTEGKAATDESVGRGQLLEMLASMALRSPNDPDATETLLRRWVDARTAEKPIAPVALALASNQLGLFLGRRDKRSEARQYFDRARDLRREALGEGHRLVAEAMYNAATFRADDVSLEEVASDLEAVVRMTKAGGPESRSLEGSALHNLAVVLEDLGRTEEARARYAEALAVLEALHGPDHPTLRPTLVRLAQLHHREGRILFALPLYERALAVATRELGAEHPIVRAIDAWKGELLEGPD